MSSGEGWQPRIGSAPSPDGHRIGDLAEAGVVPDDIGDGKLFIHGGAQLARAELQAAVADQADDRGAGRGDGGTDGGTGGIAKRAIAGGGVEPAAGRSWS
jgi:hypothetical protein